MKMGFLKKKKKILWSICSLCCLAISFLGTYQYMKSRRLLPEQTQKSGEESVLEGTYCTLKSNSLDGVPIYENAGDTVPVGFLPEGKCCQAMKTVRVKGKKWMQVSYCGLNGWLKKKRLHFISDGICYITEGTLVYVNATTEKGIKGYEEPTTLSEIVEEDMIYGTEFVIKELRNGWGKVESQGRSFWINMYYMGCYLPKNWKVETLSAAKEINLREHPGENEKSLEKIPENSRLTIKEYQKGWGKIEYEGVTGWVMLHYLTPMEGDESE